MKFRWIVNFESRQHLRTFLGRKRISRSLLKSIKFNGGKIFVNGLPTRTNAMVEKGDLVEVTLPPEPSNPHVGLSDVPIDVRYEDADYLIVNKPPFLPTVQSAANQKDTLVNRVKNYYVKNNYESRVVHVVTRLDQDTSGLVIFAKHRFAHTVMDQDLRQRKINKMYLTIVEGTFTNQHGIIGGGKGISYFQGVSISITNSIGKENNIMLTYDEFKEAMDNGFIKGDTVQIVRKNGKIHDYVLDGEQVEPHEILSLEKVSDIIKELADELGVSKTYIEKIIRVVNIHSELLKKRIDYF